MSKSLRTVLAAAVAVAGFASTATFAQSPSEEATSRSVLAQIDKDAALRADVLHVQTIGSTVYLSGQVDSDAEGADAVQAARSVPTVSKVVNMLVYSGSN